MESYDVFLIGNFVALPAFREKYGVYDAANQSWVIVTKWQSALQVSGQLGALIGVFLAGPLTSRIGYRWATLTGLMLLNVFIFAFYFAESLPVIFVAQLLEGLPWGIFIGNAGILQRDRPDQAASPGYADAADVLGDWEYHRWCRHLPLPKYW
jgi:SP family general alpha glucoside:H+ symporter-like MFS transporter